MGWDCLHWVFKGWTPGGEGGGSVGLLGPPSLQGFPFFIAKHRKFLWNLKLDPKKVSPLDPPPPRGLVGVPPGWVGGLGGPPVLKKQIPDWDVCYLGGQGFPRDVPYRLPPAAENSRRIFERPTSNMRRGFSRGSSKGDDIPLHRPNTVNAPHNNQTVFVTFSNV